MPVADCRRQIPGEGIIAEVQFCQECEVANGVGYASRDVSAPKIQNPEVSEVKNVKRECAQVAAAKP